MTKPKCRIHHPHKGRPSCQPLDTYVYVEAVRRINEMSLNQLVKTFTLTFSSGHVSSDRWPSTTGEGLRHWMQKFRKEHVHGASTEMSAGLERMIANQIGALRRETGLLTHN